MSEFFINSKVSSSERFDMSKFMEFTDNFDPLTSNFFRELSKLKTRGTTHVMGEESRADQLSYRIYKDTQYWWIILLFNNIKDPDNLDSGQEIVYPALLEVENILFSLKAKQKSAKSGG